MFVKIQSVSDLITNSSSEVFIVYTKEGINSFKEIISTLIGDDFDNHFDLVIYTNDYLMDDYIESGSELSFEDWCFEYDQDNWEGSTAIEGFSVIAKDPNDLSKAKAINNIYGLFEGEERYC